MRYKIKMLCYDFGNPEPYEDEVEMIFDDRKDAMITLLQCAIEEVDELNDPYICEERREDPRYFQIDLDGDADAIIRCWDGEEDYSIVTIYNIEEVQE